MDSSISIHPIAIALPKFQNLNMPENDHALHIVVNACTLRVAGGLSIGINFLRSFTEIDSKHRITAFVPPGIGYESLQSEKLEIIPIPINLQKAQNRLSLDHFWLPKQIKNIKPDLIFSMGNIALPIKDIPQAVFLHWPYAVYPEGPFWDQMPFIPKFLRKIRVWQFRWYHQYAGLTFVQGQHMKTRLLQYYPVKENQVVVIPSAIDSRLDDQASPLFNLQKNGVKKMVLGYISRYYSHKNFEILLQAAKILKERKTEACIVITLEKSHGKESADFLTKLETENLSEYLVNIGQVSFQSVSGFYNSIDTLVFPSLLETFGLPQVEAMKFGKPVLVSDLDFAHEINQEAGIYFDPQNPEDLADKIKYLVENPDVLKDLHEKSKARFKSFKNWNGVVTKFIFELEKFHKTWITN